MPDGMPMAAIAGSCSASSLPTEFASALTTSESDSSLSLGGHAVLTEWGVHFDGVDDWATVQTPEYGLDTTWTYSLWFSKAECNPNAQVNWEYMLAHSASENSDVNTRDRGAPGGDDNVHMYLGCRQGDASSNWLFKNYTAPDAPPTVSGRQLLLPTFSRGDTFKSARSIRLLKSRCDRSWRATCCGL